MNRHVQDELSAFMDGELSPEEETRVLLHLDGCVSCREVYEELQSVSLELGEYGETLEPSDGMTDRVWLLIEREEQRRERRASWLTGGGMVACLLGVLALGLSPWGMIAYRFVSMVIRSVWTGVKVLATVLSLSPITVGGLWIAAVLLMSVSIWGIRKLVPRMSTGDMI